MRKVVQLRSRLVQHHLIISDDGIYIIDGGFIGGISRIAHLLEEIGRDFSDIRSIILSHGHLDHTYNVSRLQELASCPIFAPCGDRDHIVGRYRYRGWNRICGTTEWLGRRLLGYRPPSIDRWFKPGDLIDGLEVVGLPGHTIGHCGFLLPEQGLLLAGDLASCHFSKAHLPPRVINDDHSEAKRSVKKAAGMKLEGIMLNHARAQSPKELWSRLVDLANHL